MVVTGVPVRSAMILVARGARASIMANSPTTTATTANPFVAFGLSENLTIYLFNN